jgi:hypothetical protein
MNGNRKPRLLLTFARYKIAELIVFCRFVISSLTGNANFTSTNPTLPAATASVDALEGAKEAAMGGGKTEKLILKQANAATVDLFRQMVTSVENQGQSDRAILSSSGFNVTKVPEPVGPIGPPAPPKVIRTKEPGTIKAMIPKVRGVTSVNWRIALESAPTVYLETVQTSAGHYTFRDLTGGATYLVQASVVSTNGQSAWGPTSALMAL